MGVKSWVDRKINLTASTILNHRLGDAKVNIIIINNPTDSEVFASLDQNVSASNYEVRVPGKLKGMIIRSSEIRDVYLLCASTVTGIQLHEVLVDDPLFVYFLESVTGSVVVSSTTGLKASELNIDAVTKNLNVQTGDTINIANIEGKDAHDAPSTGKPVQVGGVRRVADPALADGDAGSLRINAKGEAMVELSGSNVEAAPGAAPPAKGILIGGSDGSVMKIPFVGPMNLDAVDATYNKLLMGGLGHLFNGATWDRWRGNIESTVLASGARTALAVSSNLVNYNAKGVILTLNVTVASGTGGLQVIIQGIDPISGTAYSITATPTAITATGLRTYMLYPGASMTAAGSMGQVSAGSLPRTWRVLVNVGDASSYTYSIGYALII